MQASASRTLPSTSFLSLRAGLNLGDFSIDPGTGDSRLLREFSFRPRTFGVTFTYRH